MSVRLHPRHQIVAGARYDISQAVNAAIGKYDLTTAELLNLLAHEIETWSGYAIRDEREESQEREIINKGT